MSGITLSLTLLSLFVSSQKASEIEGDLLEQSESKGKLWFVCQVVLTSIALFLHNVLKDFGRYLLLSYAVYELILKFNWLVLKHIRRFIRDQYDLNMWQGFITFDLVNTITALLIGFCLVKLSAQRGAGILLLSCGLFIARMALLSGVQSAAEILVFAITPALLGAVIARWIQLRHSEDSLLLTSKD